MPVSTLDLDGGGGVVLLDLAFWTADWMSGTNPGRSDYDGDGVVTLLDLGTWAKPYFSARDLSSSATCP